MKIGPVLFLIVFAASAFGQPNPGTPPSRIFNFPPVGLASTETAQVNIVSTSAANVGPGATATSCSGTITFTDANGKTIGTPANFTTAGSEIYSKQLTFSQLGASGTRGEFAASIAVSGNSMPYTRSFCTFNYSLETFDTTTGATHVFVGNSGTTLGAVLIPGTLR